MLTTRWHEDRGIRINGFPRCAETIVGNTSTLDHKLTSGCLAGLSLLLFSCGGGIETCGRYQLDADRFANITADEAIKNGTWPQEKRAVLITGLQTMQFTLELEEDGSYRAEVQPAYSTERFFRSGTWVLSGSSIRLDQTQEDGNEKENSMQGTLQEGIILLKEKIANHDVTFVLRHEHLAQPAAPR